MIKIKQLSLFEKELIPGWYYGYNPEEKPIKKLVMKVCRLESKTRKGYNIHIIGVGAQEASASQLEPLLFVRRKDMLVFCKEMRVCVEQKEQWENYLRSRENGTQANLLHNTD